MYNYYERSTKIHNFVKNTPIPQNGNKNTYNLVKDIPHITIL